MTQADAQAAFRARLEVDDLDDVLLIQALTHRSFAAEHPDEPHNERLELLGDAVVDLAVTTVLFATDPAADEGELSRRRARLVREGSLAAVARGVGLGEVLRLGRGESLSGGADKDSLLADALEAVVGAVMLHGGYVRAAALVEHLLADALHAVARGEDPEDGLGGALDPKTTLQEHLARQGAGTPAYSTTQQGPAHAPSFQAVVSVDGEVLGQGAGGSKKEATQAAAADALSTLALG